MTFVVVMMLTITVNVILRYAFQLPMRGIGEIVELMMVLLVFLALAYAAARGSNIAVTLVTSRLPKRPRVILGSITSFYAVVNCIDFSVRGAELFVVSSADNFAIANQDSADGGIRLDGADAFFGKPESGKHKFFVDCVHFMVRGIFQLLEVAFCIYRAETGLV